MAKVTLEFHCENNAEALEIKQAVLEFVRRTMPPAANAKVDIEDHEVAKKLHPVVTLTVTTKTRPTKGGDLAVVVT